MSLLIALTLTLATPPLPDAPIDSFEPTVRRQFEEAIGQIDAAPDDGDACGALGMLYHAYEMYDLALACYERASALDEGDWRWRYGAAIMLADVGRPDEARAAFDDVLQAVPEHSAARLRRADIDREDGRYDVALAGYDKVIATKRNVAQAHFGRGRVLLAQGQHEDALMALAFARLETPAYGAMWYATGQALRQFGNREAAVEAFEQAEFYRGQEPPLTDDFAKAVDDLATGAIVALHAGIEHLRAGRLEQAMPLLEEAVRIDPDLAEAHAQLGAAHLVGGNLDVAERALREAVRLHADYVDALYNLGLIAYRRNDWSQAAERFANVVEIRPDRGDAFLGLGMARSRGGDDAGAIAPLVRATELLPQDSRTHRWLNTVLIDSRRYADALAALRRAEIALPKDDVLAQRRAWLLATAPDDAVRDPTAALAIADELASRIDHPRVHDTHAAALAATGAFDAAAAIVREAVATLGSGSLETAMRARLKLYESGRPYRLP